MDNILTCFESKPAKYVEIIKMVIGVFVAPAAKPPSRQGVAAAKGEKSLDIAPNVVPTFLYFLCSPKISYSDFSEVRSHCFEIGFIIRVLSQAQVESKANFLQIPNASKKILETKW